MASAIQTNGPNATLPAWARAWILAVEGGHSNDASDRGGETRFGISKAAHPDVDLDTLTQDGAAAIYGYWYWRPIRGAELPTAAALAVFDAAVIHGVGAAVTMLQRTLRTIGAYEPRSAHVALDGIVGPNTIAAARRGFAPERRIDTLAWYLAERTLYIAAIARRDQSQQRFLRGWARRLFLLEATCLQIGGAK